MRGTMSILRNYNDVYITKSETGSDFFFYVYPPNPANLKISSLKKFHGQTSVLKKIIKTLYITCILIKLI